MLLCATTFAATASATPHIVPTPEQNLQMGLEAQSAREYRTMLNRLRESASHGNVEAQEMLGMALLVGPTLYGPTVKANRCEAGLWLRKAVAQGSAVGKVQLDFLNRLRQSPSGQDVCAAWGG
jgi:TPR repeat protein